MNNIKKARENAGMSQKEVAISLKVSAPTVSEWESGKKNPSAKNMKELARLFNASIDYLLGEENKSLFDLAKEAIYTKEFESLSETDKIKALESVRKPVFLNFDISEEKIPTPSKDDVGVLTREELERISAAMAEMNEEGRERAVEMVEDLAAGGRFKKHCSDAMDKEA